MVSRKAHSATSWMALIAAALVMMFLGFRTLNMRLIGAYAVAAAVVLVIAQLTFDVYGKIVDISGHESTLEGRGGLWEAVTALPARALSLELVLKAFG